MISVISVKFNISDFDMFRSTRGRCYPGNFLLSLTDTILIYLSMSDTNFHLYESSIPHYIGYQKEFGGDTTGLSTLDLLDNWMMRMSLGFKKGDVIITNYDSLNILGIVHFPDSINNDSIVEVEIVVDLDGLFEIRQSNLDSTNKSLMMNTQNVYLKNR